MKLTIAFLMLFIMQVNAATFAQQLTLSRNKITLSQVFNEVYKQTGYTVVWNSAQLKGSSVIKTNFINTPLAEVIAKCLEGESLSFDIRDNTIIIKPKVPSFLDRVVAAFINIDVRGRILDGKGDPLSGATIAVKGLRQAVRTGADGSFFLQNVQEGSILVITYTGYVSKEFKASTNIGTIHMEIAVGDLEEVGVTVNTGYQRIKPEQSTGAVSQIGTKEYESRISTDFLDGLVNRLPGLMINNNVGFTSTVPGSTSSTSRSLFNIRGISTMSADQSPLIVIDGYPTELTLDMIDPNEIKSVTILKDAAAATVYGVRASNGVIVIERKQAAKGKTQVNLRATTAFTPKENYSRYRWADDASSIVANYQRVNSAQSINSSTFGLLSTGIASNGGTVQRSAVYYILAQQAAKMITPDQANSAFNDLIGYNNMDDYNKLFRRTAVKQNYNLNISGGNDNALYYITGNYTGNQQSAQLNDNSKFTLSARTLLKFTPRLSLELTTDYYEERYNNAPIPGIESVSPYSRFQDINGNPTYLVENGISPYYNNVLMSQGLDDLLYYPLVEMKEVTDKQHSVNNRVTANFKYNIGGGFDLSFGGIYENSTGESRHDASDASQESRKYVNSYVSKNADGTYKYNIPKGGFLRQRETKSSGFTVRTQLNFNKILAGEHSINAILGAEVRKQVDKGLTTSAFGYNDESLLQQSIDYSSIINSTIRGSFGFIQPLAGQAAFDNLFNQQYAENRYISGYSNVVYSYKGKYSATGSVRIDQSNLFGTNPKYKYKPLWSVGAAWNIHKELFLQNASWLNQLKLRTAYGFNGNVAKLSLPEVIARSVLNVNTSPATPALKLVSYANTSLRWEQTQNFNTGLDFGIFKNINGSIDYYRKKSTDLLGNTLIDPTLGVSPTLINQATIRNKGLEFSLHADWIAEGKINWNTGIVLSRNTSKVLDVYQKADFSPRTLNSLGYVQNYPVGAMFSFNYAGLDQEGFPLLRNSDGTIYRTNAANTPTTALMSSETGDLSSYSGSSIPTINGGLSNRVDIGNFYIFAMINYYGGFKVRIPRPVTNVSRPLEGAGNYWKVAGDESNTDVMGLAGYASIISGYVYAASDKYVVNGDYITLGDLTVSYSFDKFKFIKNIGFKHFEVKAQASNVYTVGMNRENFSMATGSYQKSYLTPTYTIALFTTF